MAADLVTAFVDLAKPVFVGGIPIRRLAIREPRSKDFVAFGPLVHHHRSGGLRVSLEMIDVASDYLRRGLVGLDAAETSELLDSLPLSDTFRLIRAMAQLIPNAAPNDVSLYQDVIAFDEHMMSIREADEMGISELIYTVKRLGMHRKMQQDERRRRGGK